MKKEETKTNLPRVVYGGQCYVDGGKKGFYIFVKKGNDYEKMIFAQKSITLWNKVKGGVYEIKDVTATGASFGIFNPTGEMCKDPDVLNQIALKELEYINDTQERTATSSMKKNEQSFMNKTLAELKEMAKKDYRFKAGLKKWVNDNI